jgi:L-asparaginase
MPAIPYKKPVTFYHEMKNSIYVLKLIPGMKPDVLSYIFKHYDCVVIESFGVGGLPESIVGEFYKEMTEWVRHGKIVVMTTQVANEGSNMTVYEVGKKVKQDFDLIEAYDMTLEAVITKLMWIMSMEQMSYAEVKERFYSSVNHDILFHE